ncbi:hypothetical protein NPIL_487641 [Nephila pilipes]|uniref:Uncharacterized protein n=1 Tax=Nephila pilipes TaxID=299642 RepID=A0A8X6UAC0_NEPPI|nr:hypothetical protein NPIL_487641 [Nephila pilipes]
MNSNIVTISELIKHRNLVKRNGEKIFSIQIDTTQDINVAYQRAVIVRYIKDNEECERLICVINCVSEKERLWQHRHNQHYQHDTSLNPRNSRPGEQPHYLGPMSSRRYQDRGVSELHPTDQLAKPGRKERILNSPLCHSGRSRRPHLTKDCTKDMDPPSTCAHCQGEHTANHLQCPMNPPKKEDKQKKAAEDRQKLRAALKEKNAIRTGVSTARPNDRTTPTSYAEAAKISPSPPPPPKLNHQNHFNPTDGAGQETNTTLIDDQLSPAQLLSHWTRPPPPDLTLSFHIRTKPASTEELRLNRYNKAVTHST